MLAPRQNFTGDVWVNMVEMFEDGFNGSVVGKVTFETKAWTNWHKHSQGQILIVTEGVGYYQEKESPVQIIRTGDVVKIPKDTEYWHGASHNSTMVHTAIVPGGSTTWLKEVTYVFQ
ncbi:MAG: cupin domain-containing protein [Labilibaculum sp.]|nr:cupin domain-containing protein [Labilibaculum sp.]